MNVAVIGSGYVGLVSAVGLAKLGHDVTAIDVDLTRVAMLERGEAPFHEPGLVEALGELLAGGSFRVTGAFAAAAAADVILLCVQTPPLPSGAVELSFVEDAARTLAEALVASEPRRRVVAVRSTVPPGTNQRLLAPLLSGVETAVASNPEFLREGSALDDFLQADRIVVGVEEPWAAEMMTDLYTPLAAPIIVTTPGTAELAKYASNAFLATLVSFSNEIAHLCEATPGVDVEDVLGIVHGDRRLAGDGGRAGIVSYLKAGCGYGGSCLPKDLGALIAYGRDSGETLALLQAVESVNRNQAGRLAGLAERSLGGLRGRRIAVLGAAFKAGTDDMRDSPAVRVVGELLERGAVVAVYDPLVASERLRDALPDGVEVRASLAAAIADADACLVTTLDPEFFQLDRLLRERNGTRPVVVDGRRGISAAGFPDSGYVGVGRAGPWS